MILLVMKAKLVGHIKQKQMLLSHHRLLWFPKSSSGHENAGDTEQDSANVFTLGLPV